MRHPGIGIERGPGLAFICVIAAALAIPGPGIRAAPETIARSLAYDLRDLRIRPVGDSIGVDLDGAASIGRIGEPNLPVDIVRIVLPPGTDVASCALVEAETVRLPGEHAIAPAQPPRILSDLGGNARVGPDASIYGSSEPYPRQIVTVLSTGNLGGLAVASFAVHPVRTIPKEKRLLFHPRIRFQVALAPAARSDAPAPVSSAARASYGEIAGKLLSNPEDVPVSFGRASDVRRSKGPASDAREIEYVIIADEELAPAFQPLAEWKTRKGVPAGIATTSWIYGEFPGRDGPEKIRNFLSHARAEWGTIWVLLGGDVGRVPARFAYAMDCAAGFEKDENWIPCDLYYSDLDRTWNEGGDPEIYGEVADDVDLYPDLFVGRAPANTPAQARAFVEKVLRYEKDPPPDYLLRILFAAEVLWDSPYTDQGIAKDRIGREEVPPRYEIERLYESQGTESRESVLEAIGRGTSIINHDGHAWYTVMCVGKGDLRIRDIDALRNGPRFSILYSIGCWQAAFDRDSIAEHFVLNPAGGGVACIGNSRYGWGAMGDPGYGYSDRFDREFYRCLFRRGIHRIGAALALSKATFVPFSRQENVYRWCQYQINLLGDPEMPVWTDVPRRLAVHHPASVPAGPGTIAIAVSDGDSPVADALVCASKEGEVYAAGRTDAGGRIAFSISPLSPAGVLYVTVTAHNYLPYEGTVEVSSEDAHLAEAGTVIDDGDGDGRLDPGESARLFVRLRNYGSRGAEGVEGFLESLDAGATVLEGRASYGDIGPGETALPREPFRLALGDGWADGDAVRLKLAATDASRRRWESILSLRVAAPRFSRRNVRIDDRALGDGDGIPEPGEAFEIRVEIENAGSARLEYAKATLATDDPFLAIGEGIDGPRILAPGGIRTESFPAAIDAACPSPHFPEVSIEILSADGRTYAEPLELTIGPTGFSDDVESGPGEWSAPGEGNLWHIAGHRSHSGARSWYCGIDETRRYSKGNESILVSPPFRVGRDPILSFWAWYDVAVYGTTGLHVEVGDGAIWTKLDFIGSGGALQPLLMGNDWLPYAYDLAAFPPGTALRVRFRFTSDREGEREGVYIDDIALRSRERALETAFARGDASADGRFDLADPIVILSYLFAAGPAPTCLRAADVDDDGRIDLADPIGLLHALFAGGAPPAPPHPECGLDRTFDGLSCESYGRCP